jgi:hypothetical protein
MNGRVTGIGDVVGTRRSAPARCIVHALRAAAFLSVVASLGLAGCSSSGLAPGLSNVSTRGTTVAFESIDGPPESVFRTLVQQLNQEAQARQVAVVSRETAASYRIRGYVAAHVVGKKTRPDARPGAPPTTR